MPAIVVTYVLPFVIFIVVFLVVFLISWIILKILVNSLGNLLHKFKAFSVIDRLLGAIFQLFISFILLLLMSYIINLLASSFESVYLWYLEDLSNSCGISTWFTQDVLNFVLGYIS